MKPSPKPITRGPRFLRDWLNDLLKFVIATRPLASETCELSELPDGTRIEPIIAGGPAAAAAAEYQPFELAVVTDSEEDPPVQKIRVYASTLAGGSSTDLGFSEGDDPPYLLTPSEGILQGGITIDSNGEVTSRSLEIVSSLTEDTNTSFYVEIGTVSASGDSWVVSNSRYGPISANICRNWYANAAPYYGVSWV